MVTARIPENKSSLPLEMFGFFWRKVSCCACSLSWPGTHCAVQTGPVRRELAGISSLLHMWVSGMELRLSRLAGIFQTQHQAWDYRHVYNAWPTLGFSFPPKYYRFLFYQIQKVSFARGYTVNTVNIGNTLLQPFNSVVLACESHRTGINK